MHYQDQLRKSEDNPPKAFTVIISCCLFKDIHKQRSKEYSQSDIELCERPQTTCDLVRRQFFDDEGSHCRVEAHTKALAEAEEYKCVDVGDVNEESDDEGERIYY